MLIMASSNILTRKQHQKMSNDQLIGFAMKVQENLSPKKTLFPTEKRDQCKITQHRHEN